MTWRGDATCESAINPGRSLQFKKTKTMFKNTNNLLSSKLQVSILFISLTNHYNKTVIVW